MILHLGRDCWVCFHDPLVLPQSFQWERSDCHAYSTGRLGQDITQREVYCKYGQCVVAAEGFKLLPKQNNMHNMQVHSCSEPIIDLAAADILQMHHALSEMAWPTWLATSPSGRHCSRNKSLDNLGLRIQRRAILQRFLS